MRRAALQRVTASGVFVWPWTVSAGLAIVTGAAGGGGGGGGATTLKVGEQTYHAAGGDGGDGGGGGGLDDGQPVNGKRGSGCHYGGGGDGGRGAIVAATDGQMVSNGGDGGKGFPGETLIVELQNLSRGDHLEIDIGHGGSGGDGGKGYTEGSPGVVGNGGSVMFVPLHMS